MKSYSHSDCNNNKIDFKLDKLFNYKTNGFFIELGANDGLFQSNTAFFEKFRNWSGILIEPSKKGFELCKKNRSNSLCLNYACVSKNYEQEYILGDFKDIHPMSSINGLRLKRKKMVKVPAITLDKILDKHLQNNQIDFLSLDVEGYELNVLKGISFDKYRPKYILIEIYNVDYNKILKLLESNNYKLHSNFTNYNLKDNPNWDKTHNDYLFVDNS